MSAATAWATAPLRPIRPGLRVLVAGHDMRFFAVLADRLRQAGADVRVDEWEHHNRHDEPDSFELLGWAEVIIAEWCLGNAIWYSRNKLPGQKLLVHFHRFEFDTEFPADVAIDHVDGVVFAGPHFRDDSITAFGWPAQRCVYVPNPVDVASLQQPKTDDAPFTLGLLGWHRELKRLDLALDTLERLRADDERFRLTVKGQSPKDYDWIWDDDAERGYFERQFARVESSALLGDAVVFEGYGDVIEWFSRVGWITSFSDVESFHLAVAEGMACRSVPLIRRREGVEQLFPARWVFDDPDGFAGHVLATTADGTWAEQGEAAQAFIADHYDLKPIADAWVSLVFGAERDG